VPEYTKKFAVAHLLYDLGEKVYAEPTHLSYKFVHQMTEDQLEFFSRKIDSKIYPEIGCRWMQRMVLSENKWIIVQEDKYRYYIHVGNYKLVRIVIGEFLYCEVLWEN
jgi:hypothetical protein